MGQCVRTSGLESIQISKSFPTTTKVPNTTHCIGNYLQISVTIIIYLDPSIQNITMQLKHFKESASSTHHYMITFDCSRSSLLNSQVHKLNFQFINKFHATFVEDHFEMSMHLMGPISQVLF